MLSLILGMCCSLKFGRSPISSLGLHRRRAAALGDHLQTPALSKMSIAARSAVYGRYFAVATIGSLVLVHCRRFEVAEILVDLYSPQLGIGVWSPHMNSSKS